MINARTWHRFFVSGYAFFPGFILLFGFSNTPALALPGVALLLWSFLVALAGAVQGVLLALGRLSLGCPVCGAKSRVSGGNADGMRLDCPACGTLRLKTGRFFRLQVIRPGSKDDDLAECPPPTKGILKLPLRHPLPFLALFLPVVGSIAASAVIYKFTLFFLLVPGFWCYAVACFLLDALFTGRIQDNTGTSLRAKAPFRFWRECAIWTLAYLFALSFPVGFALQERGRAERAAAVQGK